MLTINRYGGQPKPICFVGKNANGVVMTDLCDMEACRATKVTSTPKPTTTTTTTTTPRPSGCTSTSGQRCKFPYKDWLGRSVTKCEWNWGYKVCAVTTDSSGYGRRYQVCSSNCP